MAEQNEYEAGLPHVSYDMARWLWSGLHDGPPSGEEQIKEFLKLTHNCTHALKLGLSRN